MASFVRPSLILNMDIDGRLYNDDLIAEIKRSYAYVSPSVISSHDVELPEDAGAMQPPIENTIRLSVRLHKPYWDPKDPDAQELWENVMPKWLHNMISKVSNTITASNNVREEKSIEPLKYTWVEFEFFENCTIAELTEVDSSITDACIADVEKVRDMVSDGAFGEGVVRVSIPSEASYIKQRDAAIEAAAEAARAEEAAAAMAHAEAIEEEPYDGEGGFDEGLVAVEEEAESADGRDLITKVPPFNVNKREWGVEFADGTTRIWDSEAGSFIG